MIKIFFKWFWSKQEGLWRWIHREFQDSAENLMRDLKSMRALWNWLFLMLYAWVVVWGVLYYPTITIKTAIITTGGIVSWIFTNYVASKTVEKVFNGKGKAKPDAQDDINGSD